MSIEQKWKIRKIPNNSPFSFEIKSPPPHLPIAIRMIFIIHHKSQPILKRKKKVHAVEKKSLYIVLVKQKGNLRYFVVSFEKSLTKESFYGFELKFRKPKNFGNFAVVQGLGHIRGDRFHNTLPF